MEYKIKGTKSLDDILVLKRVAEMERERYSKSGDYSVTDCINPSRVVHLRKRWGHLVTLSLDSTTGSMMGTALHEYFDKYLSMWCDKHDYEGYNLEEQVQVDILDRKISGRYDIREGSHLYDLKTAKVWKLIFDPTLVEYHEQQNFYNLLINMSSGLKLDTINLIVVYKDWQEGMALRDPNYPQHQAMEYNLTKWDYCDSLQLLTDRVQSLIDSEELKDDDLPMCTREERWERHQGGETIHFAILKNRLAKRATKVLKGGSLEDAVAVANSMKGMTRESVIEIRYAAPKRCQKYCEVNEHCCFWKEWSRKHREGKVNDYVDFKV